MYALVKFELLGYIRSIAEKNILFSVLREKNLKTDWVPVFYI